MEKKKPYIMVRNLEPSVIAKIDSIAAKNNLSREEYLRRYLTKLSVTEELKEQEEKYSTLINKLSDVIEANTYMMERIRFFMENEI